MFETRGLRTDAIHARPLSAFPTLPAAHPVTLESILGRHPFGSALTARHAIRPGAGVGFRDFVVFQPDFQLAHSRFILSSDSSGLCIGQDLLKLHFCIAGKNTLRYQGRTDQLVQGGCVLVTVHPQGIDKFDCHPANTWEHSLTLTCRHSFLTDVLKLEPGRLPRPLDRFAAGQSPQWMYEVLPLPYRAISLVEDLLSPAYSAQFAQVHARNRAIDLACLALDLLTAPLEKPPIRFSLRDRRGFEFVREYLRESFTESPSIAQLASRVGMNRTKLMCGFHTLFGETIKQHVTRLQMEYAVKMLDEGASCRDIACALGYRHQSSFTTAFRTYFGRAPKQSRFGPAMNIKRCAGPLREA